MRILANYGYKNNGDTYSVTFETMGDVPKELAETVVDDLFRLAKAAIQRQLNPAEDPLEFPPRENIVIPKPAAKANGKKENSEKPTLKDPEAPATPKQKSLIIRLAKERGHFVNNLHNFTMRDASEKIDELMAVTV